MEQQVQPGTDVRYQEVGSGKGCGGETLGLEYGNGQTCRGEHLRVVVAVAQAGAGYGREVPYVVGFGPSFVACWEYVHGMTRRSEGAAYRTERVGREYVDFEKLFELAHA
jgi:hypothetical protein